MALLMRRLLVDAQAKLRRMVEEHSSSLTARIESDYPNAIPAPVSSDTLSKLSNSSSSASSDTSSLVKEEPEAANCDVELKVEARRSKSLGNAEPDEEEIQKKDVKKTKSNPVKCELVKDKEEGAKRSSAESVRVSPEPGCSNQKENESTSPRSSKSIEEGREEEQRCSSHFTKSSSSSCSASVVRKVRQENERLQAEITRLRRLVVSSASSVFSDKKPANTDNKLEMELQLAKEALTTLKSDRRRLKAEKFELLAQMKQLYATLEDKETELREFIRTYEQRVRDNESSFQQLSTEREERERERWSLLRHARDEAERSLSLAAQLNAKELQLQQAQEQLQEARRQLGGCLSDQESVASRHNGGLTPSGLVGERGSCSADSGVRVNSDKESAANLSDSTTGNNVEAETISLVSSIPPPDMYQSKDFISPTLSPLNANSGFLSRTINSRSVEQLNSPLDSEPLPVTRRFKNPRGGRGGTWGSISRVFARSRHRNKSIIQENADNFESYRSWSPLTEEGYAEKLRLLREASSIPMEKWRAPTVLAWLEVALGMPQYGSRCSENIKSGKIGPLHGQVLLELSDLELECGFGITHPMHRKKIRLAIEEQRQPAFVRYPCIAQLGHTWVASEWLPDLGLSQYSESFTANMVDARMLEHLSKKELEKYLGVTRKFHQASIVHGIHLLRIMKYDRQALAVRRHQCENIDADPLVWTNQRFIRWARSIDLTEYADNLKDSGVHGGLVVLEPSFNGDTMATALGIPTSKNIIRRHLNAELEALVLPARYVIFCQMDELQSEAARVISKHGK